MAVVVIGALAYIWVSAGSGEASGDISAPTLEAQFEDAVDAGDNRILFEIVPEESQVRFLIDEVLRGQPKRVIGRTNQVAGQVLVSFDSPQNSEVGPIRVNVRTLVTDDEFRNRAIRGQILQSQRDEFEFAQFTPTEISGLPESITMGTPFTFTIQGDLQIRDITRPVTFEARVTPISEDRIHGTATAQVLRSDYGLEIPRVPGVADVSNEVDLEIEFIAQAVDPGA
ncbi:MAG: YceI family protein [Chloroflexota bacterium]